MALLQAIGGDACVNRVLAQAPQFGALRWRTSATRSGREMHVRRSCRHIDAACRGVARRAAGQRPRTFQRSVEVNDFLEKMAEMTPAPIKPTISFSVAEQIDIRVRTIRSVGEVVGSDKLMRLRVGFGDHERTIIAGIRLERENPRELEGRQALFVVNLEPRKMFGVLSEGMLFDIGFSDGLRPVLAIPETPVPDGCRAA